MDHVNFWTFFMEKKSTKHTLMYLVEQPMFLYKMNSEKAITINIKHITVKKRLENSQKSLYACTPTIIIRIKSPYFILPEFIYLFIFAVKKQELKCHPKIVD